jgi:hypothetical protein
MVPVLATGNEGYPRTVRMAATNKMQIVQFLAIEKE